MQKIEIAIYTILALNILWTTLWVIFSIRNWHINRLKRALLVKLMKDAVEEESHTSHPNNQS